jgi:hypothetical protein
MDMVKNRGCLSLPEVRRYLIQLCGGVKYMHRRGVIHRDLKMGNVFLDEHMDAKIGDFGLAAVVLDDKDRRQTLCGTPNYIAPEILNKSGGKGHDSKVDTWAIGIICYAMLTGGPPFASKTQTEIYTKLRHLQYEWKTDGHNFIPMQAKELVTSCLTLTAADRPEMDELVDHDFFKIGAVADEIEVLCRTTKPPWIETADPRGDKVRRGYGVDYDVICQECGVGKTANGAPRSPVGGNSHKPAIFEVELENRQGCAPVIPLSEGILYRQIAAAPTEAIAVRKAAPRNTWLRDNKEQLHEMAGVNMSNAADSPPLLDSISRELHTTATLLPTTLAARRPTQSFAAQQRQAALPPQAYVNLTQVTKSTTSSTEIDAAPHSAQGYLSERPVRAPSLRSTRSRTTRDTVFDTQRTLPKSRTIGGALGRDLAAQVVIDVPAPKNAASIPRSASHRAMPARSNLKLPTTEENETSRPPLPSQSSNKYTRALRSISANDRQTSGTGLSDSADSTTIKHPTHASTFGSTSTVRSTTLLCNTSQAAILSFLRHIHQSISSHAATTSVSASRSRPARHVPHPVVEKWVDYTNKYGIAYVLSDQTVGVVLKSTSDGPMTKPSICVVLRNAKRFYTRRSRKTEMQIVPQDGKATDIEFYEQAGNLGLKRCRVLRKMFHISTEGYDGDEKAALGRLAERLDKIHSKEMELSIENPREQLRLVVLADKFGKYMTKTLGPEISDAEEAEVEVAGGTKVEAFINFYQRLGNVGVWGYSGANGEAAGGFQFNFPDHTKVVIYPSVDEADGNQEAGNMWMDFYYLQPADARFLAKHGGFKEGALERRGILTARVAGVVAGNEEVGKKKDKEILMSNEAREKVEWIGRVVGGWIDGGGVGRMSVQKDGEGMRWEGLQEKQKDVKGDEGKKKLVWVTVGRFGGD